MAAKINVESEKGKTVWDFCTWLIKRVGLPTAVIVVAIGAGTWGAYQYMSVRVSQWAADQESDRAERDEDRQMQRELVSSQIAAFDRLTESFVGMSSDFKQFHSDFEKTHTFESGVQNVHEAQVEVLGSIRDSTLEVAERMRNAEAAMADVPAQRKESLKKQDETLVVLKDLLNATRAKTN